jgi:hypothetical protein
VGGFGVLSAVTCNGLATVSDEPYVEGYCRAHVIGGPGAFVLLAADHRDLAAAFPPKPPRGPVPAEPARVGGLLLAVR